MNSETSAPAPEHPLRLPPDERTFQRLVEVQADRLGERPCLVVESTQLTFAGVKALAADAGGVLRAAGLERGDRLAIISDDRMEIMRWLLGCLWTGVVIVPINTASRGAQLEHVLTSTGPRVVVGDAEMLQHVTPLVRPPEVEQVWQLGARDRHTWQGLRTGEQPGPAESVGPTRLRPDDPLAILFTSGTTGPSKGVICPHAQFYWWACVVGEMLSLRPEDTTYTCLPLFHTNALNAFAQALMHGSRFVVGPRFSVSRFWARAAAAEATVTYLLGTMVSMLASREPSRDDRSHRIRIALAPGTPPALWEAFAERFGISIIDAYGMTETNAVLGPVGGAQRPGWMGRVMPGFEVKVLDEANSPVPDGSAGELVMRADEPLAFASGYWRMPEATAQAWRDGWFYSGDRVVQDQGWFRFIDRIKDAIRRRGENISAWEVEQVLIQHSAVEAVAVIPVPSELGEDDVMACVVPAEGAGVDPVDLIRFCEGKIPYFAIPRYIDLLRDVPLTENGKVRKNLLRDRGVTETTWDRDREGVRVSR